MTPTVGTAIFVVGLIFCAAYVFMRLVEFKADQHWRHREDDRRQTQERLNYERQEWGRQEFKAWQKRHQEKEDLMTMPPRRPIH